jgi:hypothetical protein
MHAFFNPCLFLRGLSCPSSVQTSLTQYCLKLTIPGFPYKTPLCILWWHLLFYCLYDPPALANYSAEWSGRVWQPSADSNGNLKRTKQPLLSAVGCHIWPRKFRFKKVCQTAIIICIGLSHPRLDALWEHITAFFQGRKTLWGYKLSIIFDKEERVNLEVLFLPKI